MNRIAPLPSLRSPLVAALSLATFIALPGAVRAAPAPGAGPAEGPTAQAGITPGASDAAAGGSAVELPPAAPTPVQRPAPSGAAQPLPVPDAAPVEAPPYVPAIAPVPVSVESVPLVGRAAPNEPLPPDPTSAVEAALERRDAAPTPPPKPGTGLLVGGVLLVPGGLFLGQAGLFVSIGGDRSDKAIGAMMILGGVGALAGGGVLIAKGIRQRKKFNAWIRDHQLAVAPAASAAQAGASLSFRF